MKASDMKEAGDIIAGLDRIAKRKAGLGRVEVMVRVLGSTNHDDWFRAGGTHGTMLRAYERHLDLLAGQLRRRAAQIGLSLEN